MYNLKVIKDGRSNSDGDDLWDHFVDWVVDTRGVRYVDTVLSEMNAKNINGTPYIQFRSEEDAIVFKLRFT
jgi:hypothetical protein